MIEVKDRIPTYPGRVKLIPVSGQANTYDLSRADEPIEVGTPINKALFDSIINDFIALRTQVNETLFAITQRIQVGKVPVGSEISLAENGVLIPFIKIQDSYGGATGSLMMRKDCVTMMPVRNPADRKYENCRADLWLTNTYLKTLDAVTQAILIPAPVSVRVVEPGASWAMNLYRKVFLLSVWEQNLYPISGYGDGSIIPYFDSNARRIAQFNGAPVDHYTRSGAGDSLNADCISTTGETKKITDASATAAGIRPVLLLPNDYEVILGSPNTTNAVATAEVL